MIEHFNLQNSLPVDFITQTNWVDGDVYFCGWYADYISIESAAQSNTVAIFKIKWK